MDALTDEAEEARLLALESLNVDQSRPEERIDRVTRLSTRLFGVPMVAVALVGRDRWRATSHQGMASDDIGRADSFCEFTSALENADRRSDEGVALMIALAADAFFRIEYQRMQEWGAAAVAGAAALSRTDR